MALPLLLKPAISSERFRFVGRGNPLLFNTARQYRESFDAYGSEKSFGWTLIEHEDSVVHTGEAPARVKIPDYGHLLPDEIAGFTQQGVYDSDGKPAPFLYSGGRPWWITPLTWYNEFLSL